MRGQIHTAAGQCMQPQDDSRLTSIVVSSAGRQSPGNCLLHMLRVLEVFWDAIITQQSLKKNITCGCFGVVAVVTCVLVGGAM